MRFHQDDKELLKQIRNIIIELDIMPHKIKLYIKSDKPRYYFNINGFREYFLFSKIIGCASTCKKKELNSLIKKVKNSKYFKNKYSL